MTNLSVKDLLNLKGRCALVTGASGNLGRGIALRLGEAGADVAVHYHSSREGAESTVKALVAQRNRSAAFGADLSDPTSVQELFAALEAGGFVPDILINNAAQQPVAMLSEMTPEEWATVVRANLDGPFMTTKCCAERWVRDGTCGSIVNIASIEGLDPATGHGHYATSKAGLIMMTRAAASEFGGHGIRVNAVSPGLIRREGIEEQWPEGVSRWQEKAPLSRLGSSHDVADAVLFLVSPASRWITGANLVVDGGVSALSKW